MEEPKKIYVPYVNANDYEVIINQWYFKNNAYVKSGEVLCEVESTKTALEIESPQDGYLKILKQVNDTAQVGEVIAIISEENVDHETNNIKNENSLITRDALELISRHDLDISIFSNKGLVNSKYIYDYLEVNNQDMSVVDLDNKKELLVESFKNDPQQIVFFGNMNLVKLGIEILESKSDFNYNFYYSENSTEKIEGLTTISRKDLEFIITMGPVNFFGNYLNRSKNKLIDELVAKKANFPNLVHETASLSRKSLIGQGNLIGAFTYLGPFVVIGNFNTILAYSSLAHDTKMENFNYLADGCRIAGNVSIKNYIKLGISVNVNKRIVIDDEAEVNSGITVIDHLDAMKKLKS